MRISDWSSDVCSSDLIGDEAQAMHIRWRIIAITAVAPRRRRHQPDLLVMADHPLGDPARFRGMADVHMTCRFSRKAFVTTLTDESAIAAAAIIGDNRMPNTG